jgi:Glycosyltransferase like family 2
MGAAPLSELATPLATGETPRTGEERGKGLSEDHSVALSVIITVVGEESLLRRCLARLVPQIEGRPIEIIVPYDSTASQVAALKEKFPEVHFAAMGTVSTTSRPGSFAAAHQIYDCRRSFALNMARGEILALLDDSAAPDPDWCDRVLEAHRLSHGVIGGCVEYEGRRLLDWAVYMQDFGRYQQPLAEGPAHSLTDINVSYKRPVLLAVKELWRVRYSEATVHWALARQGVTLWQRPQIIVRQDRGALSFRRTLAERYCWGRLFGSVRARELSFFQRLFYAGLSPLLPVILILRVAKKALRARRYGRFLLALPHLFALIAAWCLGEFFGNWKGRE